MPDDALDADHVTRERMRVTGTVQGVGYRPFVYRTAVALGLSGYVLNDSSGVLIEAEGPAEHVAELTRRLVDEAPPLARVAGVTVERVEVVGVPGFSIAESRDAGAPDSPVSIDTATCPDCLAEVDDPSDRRHGYAFTNCTNCGPRYTIVQGVPYDRPATTMSAFTMCTRCQTEYDDPADRRFHAQPNACPACGPQLRWTLSGERAASAFAGDALDAAVKLIESGGVAAVKGLGGYHLVADATNDAAVVELRRRKARDDKPFAIMVSSLEEAVSLCELGDDAIAALTSIRRPIVLAPRREAAHVSARVAPGLPELGVMLPYTPLHHLLLARARRPLVMTSGNISDEPIAHEDDDAEARLSALVDGLLQHDRPIHIRCDDSVVRAGARRLQVLRRSRGYAPERLRLPFRSEASILAVGAELKSTISIARDEWVVPSHHIGDLEHLATYRSFLQAVEHIPRLYGVVPQLIAHDLHPEYLSTKWSVDQELPSLGVQHHHAHVAACMVEHGRTDPVLAVAYDGLGYGPDGSLWGGELLIADFGSFRRVGHLLPQPMPGGVAAIREPWRMAVVWAGGHVTSRDGVDPATVDALMQLAAHRSTPLTTSAGRLFDAVAALLGCRQRVSYEAQAAIELEALARSAATAAPRYPGSVVVDRRGEMCVLDPRALVAAVLADHDREVDPSVIAAGFHHAFGTATVELASHMAAEHGLDTVALTGGVFQNWLFSEIVASGLRSNGFHVLMHAEVPPNDGGISVGQAAIAAWAESVRTWPGAAMGAKDTH